MEFDRTESSECILASHDVVNLLRFLNNTPNLQVHVIANDGSDYKIDSKCRSDISYELLTSGCIKLQISYIH